MLLNARTCWLAAAAGLTVSLVALAGCSSGDDATNAGTGLPFGRATLEQVQRGRTFVLGNGCGECHSMGKIDPNDPNWLAGAAGTNVSPGDTNLGPLGQTHAPNLTPDPTHGAIANSTERQVFNVFRWGLDPGDPRTDKVINSTADFPPNPKFVGPPMPWPSFRHLPDDELWAMVAYLKHGLKPNPHAVTASTAPPDNWAGFYSQTLGPFPPPPFPASQEQFTP